MQALTEFAEGSVEGLPNRIHEVINHHVVATPNHPALIDDKMRLTYRELDQAVDRVAAALQALGIRAGDRMMIAHVYLDEGAVVPTHSHENEQLTYILEGALRFWLGEEGTEDYRELVVSKGEVLYIPSNVPHKAEALEDTLDVDVFSPPRQDWLDGTDAYFHDR